MKMIKTKKKINKYNLNKVTETSYVYEQKKGIMQLWGKYNESTRCELNTIRTAT